MVILSALFFFKTQSPISNSLIPQQTVVRNLTINNTLFKVEIADTKEKRAQGLGGREKLADDEGMLFIFEKEGKYAFWMRGMKFAIDFIWIKRNVVVDLTSDVKAPLPDQAEESLPKYSPKVEVDQVLEVSAGTINRLNIKEGDTIKLE
ncbi:hypothetical protein A3D79_01575 [Candidatus Daviesbacteria bacterium RIFCSPHIGHO2_02_FULL_39_8]|nr:MAG: hypothetical protein A3D79_01575 [Candidatus Daviesbacteria bacterium RIFCSPHIGHO2_02_FULL_39_8]